MQCSAFLTNVLLTAFCCLPLVSFAQADSIQLEIDQHIWQPFQESYQSFDYEVFNALHSEDMIRINRKAIRSAAAYKKKNKEWFSRAKKEGYQQQIEFRFEQRVVTGNQAFETGYYKIDSQKPNGTKSTSYARFQVTLRKDGGRWKITQDWDSSTISDQQVGPEDFYSTPASQSDQDVTITIDFVQVLNNHQSEALYYYENNWKVLRKQAVAKGYIRDYQLLINESTEENQYDILLLTEYGTPEQYEQREVHFRELIDAQEGLQLKNEIKPGEFRKGVKKMTVKSSE